MREARGGVLVLGGGFAGGYVARLLGKRGATIVSPENFMLYTPMLPEAASGTLEPRHVVVPLRQMCPHAELLLARATALDEERRVVTIERPDGGADEVRYEQLVVALGAVARSLPVPGSPSTRSASRTSPTRSTSATTCCGSSRPRTPSSTGRGAAQHLTLRLRRRRLRGRRGARGALRPRRGRAPLVSAPAGRPAALGARRRGAEDPAGDPDPARRLRRTRARRAAESRSGRRRR